MQAYDLVTRRSTIVGIAAASEGEAVAAVIGKHKDQARQAGTRDGTGHKQRVISQNENPARVRLTTGFGATAGGLHLGNTSASASPLMLPTHPFEVDY